ncbi:hypothetical protein AB1N83_014011, partial [Pleurotus pulmonarius]
MGTELRCAGVAAGGRREEGSPRRIEGCRGPSTLHSLPLSRARDDGLATSVAADLLVSIPVSIVNDLVNLPLVFLPSSPTHSFPSTLLSPFPLSSPTHSLPSTLPPPSPLPASHPSSTPPSSSTACSSTRARARTVAAPPPPVPRLPSNVTPHPSWMHPVFAADIDDTRPATGCCVLAGCGGPPCVCEFVADSDSATACRGVLCHSTHQQRPYPSSSRSAIPSNGVGVGVWWSFQCEPCVRRTLLTRTGKSAF